MNFLPLASFNSYLNRADLALKRKQLTPQQNDYGAFIRLQNNFQNSRSKNPLSQFTQDMNSLNEIFTQKIVARSQDQITGKLGSSYLVLNANLKTNSFDRFI